MDESWLVIASTILWILVVAKLAAPPGPSYTAAWLFIGFQGYLLGSESVLKCFYIGGAGLIFGWYGAQIVDGSVWPRILNIWIPKFPWAPRGALSASVRIADLYIHALPYYIATQWAAGPVGLKPWLQVLTVERAYFLIIDGNLLGDGGGINEVYQIQPRASPRFFWTMQILSLVGQVLSLINAYIYASSSATNKAKQTQFDSLERLALHQIYQTQLMYYLACGVIVASIVKTHCTELAPTLKSLATAKTSATNVVASLLTSNRAANGLLYLMKQSIDR